MRLCAILLALAAILSAQTPADSGYEVITVRHILIRVKGAQFPVAPGKPELSEDEARAKAESIRVRILAGEDFAAIARQESDDPGTRNNGGDLGEIRRGITVPAFEQAAFALKAGDISEPVRTIFGYHIIQVRARSVVHQGTLK